MSSQKEIEKNKALELAIKTIEKDIGKGTVISGPGSVPGVKFISSGCISVDKVLGGGWARGRIVEIYGPESSGKTTLCLHAIAEAQKRQLKGAYVDVEHALDPEYCKALNIDMEKLLISQPNNGEDALEVVNILTRSGALDIIVVDSIAALVPKAELDGSIGDSHVGRQARLMGQAMRMLAGVTHRTNTTLMFINQIRMKVGIMFGSPETTSGGNALKFYASQRVDIRRIGGIKKGDEFIANKTKVKVVKNKVAPPFREAEFSIKYGEGIDFVGDVLGIAVAQDIVDKSGSWYSYNGERLGQGEENVITSLKDKPKLLEEIKSKLA